VKKLIFIVVVVIVLLTTVYLLFGEGVIPLKTTLPRGERLQSVYMKLQLIIGNKVQSSDTKFVNEMTRRFTRSLLIELRKIEHTVGPFEVEKLVEEGESSVGMLLKQVNEMSSIEKIRVINDDYELQNSTSDTDISGLKLDEEIYGEIFTTSSIDKSVVILDDLTNEIVMCRRIDQKHALLFYHSTGFIDSLFSRISGLEYKRIELIHPKVIIINFPDFGDEEEGSVLRMTEMIRSEQKGWVRVGLGDLERFIYFEPASEPFSDWIIGLAFEREGFSFSILGVIIFGIQTVAIFVILLFIVTTVREKKWGTGPSAPHRRYAAALARRGKLKGTGVGSGIVSSSEQKMAAMSESALVSLDELEEVFELEEVGEAVIADELEEPEDSKQDDTNEDAVAEPSGETPMNSTLMEVDSISKEREERSDEEELAKLEAVQREIMGPEAQMLEEIDTLKQLSHTDHNMDQVLHPNRPDEENIVDDYPEIQVKTEPTLDRLPDLESLVKAESGIQTEKRKVTSPKVSEDIAKKKVESVKTDEISSIFKRIEQGGRQVSNVPGTPGGSPAGTPGGSPAGTPEIAELRKKFRQFMKHLVLSKGAVLLREKDGFFKPVITVGLSRETKRKLPFKGNEKLLVNILNKDKILFIQHDAFFSGTLQKKFDPTDSSTIRSIFFCPIITRAENVVEAVQNDVPSGLNLILNPTFLGLLILCLKEDDKTNSDRILKELKEIKKKIKNIF
jgi:hypothetical protein